MQTMVQGGPKSKPLPNDQKIVLNRILKHVKLKVQSSTIILFVGIRYAMCDHLLTSVTMTDPQTSDMFQIENYVSASSGISSL